MKTGEMFMLSDGKWDDYVIRSHFVAERDFSVKGAVRAYMAETREGLRVGENGSVSYDLPGFSDWLVEHGYARDLDICEIHLGSYGEFDEDLLEGDDS